MRQTGGRIFLPSFPSSFALTSTALGHPTAATAVPRACFVDGGGGGSRCFLLMGTEDSGVARRQGGSGVGPCLDLGSLRLAEVVELAAEWMAGMQCNAMRRVAEEKRKM